MKSSFIILGLGLNKLTMIVSVHRKDIEWEVSHTCRPVYRTITVNVYRGLHTCT